MNLKNYMLLVLVFLTFMAKAQNKYFVYLKDKNNSEFKISDPSKYLSARSIKRRNDQSIAINSRDLPVNKQYISELNKIGAKVIYSSKWMNAVLVQSDPTNLFAIKSLPFVKSIEMNADIKGLRPSNTVNLSAQKTKFETTETYNYGNSLNQIQQLGADKMHKKGYTGKNIMIGVFDSGFLNADKLSVFKALFNEKRVHTTFDFVSNTKNVYDDHDHGTNVLSCIVAKSDSVLIGTSPDAIVALFTTEDIASETRLEEVNWLLAAEMADSIGVDVINSSLGYYSFDNPTQNYKYEDMTGDKTICAKAADWAASVGIIVVVSAGNEGRDVWKYITTPADADSVISVGAVSSAGTYVSFSSVGPNFKNNFKPELAAKGLSTTLSSANNSIVNANGTSFSAPLLAGFAASFKQAYPSLTSHKIREILIQSGSQYLSPDNLIGYGIPNFERAEQIANKIAKPLVLTTETNVEKDELIAFPNPSNDFSKISFLLKGKKIPIQNIKYDLYNNTGKLLKKNPSEPGNYILKTLYEGKDYTVKLIKQ